MMKGVLIRLLDNEKQTNGQLLIYNSTNLIYSAWTMELAWKNNERRVSCIPKGTYKVVPRFSEKYGDHYHIQDVPNRDLILIHVANYASDLLGCIGVGTSLVDINKDGMLDTSNSTLAMNNLRRVIGKNTFELTII